MAAESTAAPVMVCIDGSPAAHDAARWAAGYASRTDSPVQLVNALPGEEWYMEMGKVTATSDRALRDRLRQTSAQYLTDAEAAVHAVAPAVPITTTISDDEITAFVRMHSDDAQLVVIGSRRSGRVRDILLGSHTIAIANASRCPVLAWRGRSTDEAVPHTDVVVGIDGSEPADKALLVAFEHAHLIGARVVVARFWPVSALVGVDYARTLIDWEQLRGNGKAWLRDHISGVREKFPDVEVRVIYGDTSPARGLTNLSVSAGLMVVGSRGRGAAAGTVLGSISQSLLHHAYCSVLVVP